MKTRTLAFTAVMAALSYALAVASIPFILGFRLHLFQLAVFLAAVGAGPASGLLVGLVGGGGYRPYAGQPPDSRGPGATGLGCRSIG